MIMFFFLVHLLVLKGGEEMLKGKWTGGGHVFFAKYSCNLFYIFIKKHPILL
jgi:hypothetical protein